MRPGSEPARVTDRPVARRGRLAARGSRGRARRGACAGRRPRASCARSLRRLTSSPSVPPCGGAAAGDDFARRGPGVARRGAEVRRSSRPHARMRVPVAFGKPSAAVEARASGGGGRADRLEDRGPRRFYQAAKAARRARDILEVETWGRLKARQESIGDAQGAARDFDLALARRALGMPTRRWEMLKRRALEVGGDLRGRRFWATRLCATPDRRVRRRVRGVRGGAGGLQLPKRSCRDRPGNDEPGHRQGGDGDFQERPARAGGRDRRRVTA